MIKQRQNHIFKFQTVVDLLFCGFSYAAAYFIRFIVIHETSKHLSFSEYMAYILYILVGYMFIFFWSGLYASRRSGTRLKNILKVIQANAIGVFYILAFLYLVKEVDISRSFLAVFACVNTLSDLATRWLLGVILRIRRKKGKDLKEVLVIGYSRTCENYIDRVRSNPQWGYRIKGILDDSMEVGTRYRAASVIGRIDEFESYLEDPDLFEVVITLRIDDYDELGNIVNACEKAGVHTRFCPDFKNVISSDPEIEDMDGLPVINIRRVPLASLGNRILKRTEDLVIGTLALIVAAIPMLIVAVLVKTTSKGPVLFKQTRVGRHNKEFQMYKFRSMRVQDEDEEKTKWTTENDNRVTKVGKFIRRTSLDELPQIFNVLKGEMSLVGPRPERPYFVDLFKEEVPRYMIKHQVRPGITGWAQVNGYRGDTSITRRIDFDIYYIENWNIGFDFYIMFKTVFGSSKNAY